MDKFSPPTQSAEGSVRDPDIERTAKQYCRMAYRDIEAVAKHLLSIPEDEELPDATRKDIKNIHFERKYQSLLMASTNEDAY